MSRAVLVDSGVLGMMAHPRVNADLADWAEGLQRAAVEVIVPEIADYEVRRELIRRHRVDALRRLDFLGETMGYLPLTTETMRRAAELWAWARGRGRPTAVDPALDGDAILAAQAASLADAGDDVIIATDNVAHLSLFARARRWTEIGADGW